MRCVWILVALCMSGCVGSLEEAKLAGRPQGPMSVSQPSKYCQSIDNKRQTWTALAEGAGVLSGGSGLVSIPVSDAAERSAIMAGSVALGAFAIISTAIATGASTTWARDCSQ